MAFFSMPGDLSRRVALVTGGSRGIGRAIAIALAANGADVAIAFQRAEAEAADVAREIEGAGRRSVSVRADVGCTDEVDMLFSQIEESLGLVDILVNNAGMEAFHMIGEMPDEEWDRVLAVNLGGPFRCIRRASHTMPRGGTIINISSIHEAVPRKGAAHYCASKAGLAMLGKTAALELANQGIRVNTIAPGAILTDMNRDLIENATGSERWQQWIPVGRVGTVEEVAALTVFLASPASSYLTGATLTIDGGYTLNLVRYDE